MKDEAAMKALVPEYWEGKDPIRASSVWSGGYDQNYLALRTDVEARADNYVNPYVSSYFSYISLILQQSVPVKMPYWFHRGLSGVVSNTLVRDAKIFLGPPIPWHLERLRDNARMKLAKLLAIDRQSPESRTAEGLRLVDAESWAFVHFLMFGDKGIRRPKLDQFAQMVVAGTAPDVAFKEALGAPEDLEGPFGLYVGRSIYSFNQINVDAAVKREGFTVRAVAPAEVAGRRALFHTAMQRPIEARAAIAEARKAGVVPEAELAEAILLDTADKDDEAKAAYAKAVEAKTTSPYAYYRLASLMWRGNIDRETLVRVEALLTEAVKLNVRYANAYAMVAEARSELGIGDPVSMVMRAISLDPSEPSYHLSAARVLWRAQRLDEALKQAQTAQGLADTDDERRRASDMIERLNRAKGGDRSPR
jgi:tetratricopeptide (TPR) repeat protein